MWGKRAQLRGQSGWGASSVGPREPHILGASWGTSVLQLGAPPSVAPSQTCLFESSLAPAAPGAVGPQSRHRHTRVSLLYGGRGLRRGTQSGDPTGSSKWDPAS